MRTSRPQVSDAAHVDPRGIGERDTAVEQPLGIFALVDALELRELRAAVDAQRLPRLADLTAPSRRTPSVSASFTTSVR